MIGMEIRIVRNHPHETWRWFWPDVLTRLVPFWAVALIAARFMGGPRAVGLAAPPQGWPAALALSSGVGAVMLVLAVIWRAQITPGYRLPTGADQALQSFFYLILNAPAEEVFWRGTVQTLAIRGLPALGLGPTGSAILGVGAVSAIFGAYHRLGGYPWKFNFAAMLAGMVFGTLYLALPGPSIVVATIVHGLTTAGYLSWGDAALHRRRLRRLRREFGEIRIIP
jgi:membrane protease YdiL (CAAX protease family)